MQAVLRARRFDGPNWVGIWNLMRRQFKSGFADINYTIFGPVIEGALNLLVFATATATLSRLDPGSILAFMAPAMVCFAIAEKAYEVSGANLIFEKHERTHYDWIMAPLTPLERTICFAATSTACGMVIGVAVWATTLLFVPMSFAHPWAIVAFGLGAGMFHGMVGTLLGVWAEKWDQYSALYTFVILPLSYPAGMFSSISDWPLFAQAVLRLNPISYIIDGFRYGVSGQASIEPLLSLAVMVLCDLLLALWVYRWFASGYRLKS